MSWTSTPSFGIFEGERYAAEAWEGGDEITRLEVLVRESDRQRLATFSGTRDQLRELAREISAAIAMLDADAEPELEPEPEPERKPEDCGYFWEDRTKNHHTCGLPPNHSGEHVCRFSAYQLYSGHCQATAPQKLAVRGPRHELF